MKVNESGRVGDVVLARDRVRVDVTVQSPSWITCDQVHLYANGHLIRSREIPASATKLGQANEVTLSWDLNELRHDTFLVAMATGPGDLGPSWPIPFPYQPSGDTFVPRVAGATNPIWIDRDGDGMYLSARELAEWIWSASGRDESKVIKQMGSVDTAVAVQVADLAYLDGKPLWDDATFGEGVHLPEKSRNEILRLKESLATP